MTLAPFSPALRDQPAATSDIGCALALDAASAMAVYQRQTQWVDVMQRRNFAIGIPPLAGEATRTSSSAGPALSTVAAIGWT